MAAYTSNYGLHQWAPEDNFLRTDFNEDLKKIDTALGGKAAQSTVTSLQSAVSGKVGVLTGTYTGNGGSQVINLGMQPKLVLIAYSYYVLSSSNSGIGLTGMGFLVTSGGTIDCNQPGYPYTYFAFY